MKLLTILFKFYVFSNLHVSIAVTCLVLVNGKVLGKNVLSEAIVLGCATFIAYHFIRYLNRFKYGKTHMLDGFSNKYKYIIGALILIAIILFLEQLRNLNYLKTLKLLPFIVLTFLYAYSFIKINGQKYSLRYVSLLKIFMIAFVWAGVTVFFIDDFTFIGVLYFIELVLFVIALTIPFDIRDVNFDDGSIKTLPIVLGVFRTKFMAIICLVLSLLIHAFYIKTYLISYLLTAFTLSLLVVLSKPNQSRFFASFWVEGIPILWYVLISIL